MAVSPGVTPEEVEPNLAVADTSLPEKNGAPRQAPLTGRDAGDHVGGC